MLEQSGASMALSGSNHQYQLNGRHMDGTLIENAPGRKQWALLSSQRPTNSDVPTGPPLQAAATSKYFERAPKASLPNVQAAETTLESLRTDTNGNTDTAWPTPAPTDPCERVDDGPCLIGVCEVSHADTDQTSKDTHSRASTL